MTIAAGVIATGMTIGAGAGIIAGILGQTSTSISCRNITVPASAITGGTVASIATAKSLHIPRQIGPASAGSIALGRGF
jgi:hypothetical protein